MKRIFLILAILTVLGSCKKDDDIRLTKFYPGPQDTGWATARRYGEKWEATAFARRYQNYIGIDFNTFTEDGILREAMALNEIPLKIGKYQIKGQIGEYDEYVGSNFGLVSSDGDVFGPLYLHDDNSIGFLELTMVDTILKKVAGKFDTVAFVIMGEGGEDKYPRKVKFEDGEFEMDIIE
ncbi:MAG: hypothetical protein EPO28_10005 [Saprospiraceae bacterium]|nr:MAG: hypothetical protein EPO28_10005 [Saprospiraceae bacterium]